MWQSIARFILKYRLFFLIILALATAFMAYKGQDIQMSYDFAKVIPEDDPIYVNYKEFQKKFGEDGNVMVLAVESKDIFKLNFFNDWYELGNEIKEVDGIEKVLSIPHSFTLNKDKEQKNFQVNQLVTRKLNSQAELDSIKQIFKNLPFYRRLLYIEDKNVSLMAVTFNKAMLDSKDRIDIVDNVNKIAHKFEEKYDVEVRKSGLPFMRTINVKLISSELKLFVILALCFTALVLFILFRNLYAVVFPLLVVMISVVWSIGIIVLLGYKITLLTGLIPSLIVVIGIPNCVYIINKFHAEYKKHKEKHAAVQKVIEKIGYVTLFTNLTTATGFGVFYFTHSKILSEFGLVASLNVLSTFFISIIAIPLLFSYLPSPSEKHIDHLDSPLFNRLLEIFNYWARHKRKHVYIITIIITVISLFGITKLKTTGYMFDDLPKDTREYRDLSFISGALNGVTPFEILIDTKKKGKATQLSTLNKINQVQDSLEALNAFSRPFSIVEGIKFANQSFFNGSPSQYRLPNSMEKNFVYSYLAKTNSESDLMNAFIDTNQQTARISLQMKDIGSHQLRPFLAKVQTTVNNVLDTAKYDVTYTGTSLVVMEGNKFLINGLVNSVFLAFIIIAILMGFLFQSFRMLLISMLPNTIPLLCTAGIMGYFNIPLKPSTVLIFSIAFGISVDDTIHFLAKYKQELFRHKWDIKKTVSISLFETGHSMLYTSIILFFGFIVFTASDFNGTVNLGLLSSITLVIAMMTNLILLPSLLLSFKNFLDRKALKQETIIRVFDEEIDIQLDKLDFKKKDAPSTDEK